MTRWLVGLAVISFILVDLYLIEIVVGRAFSTRHHKVSTITTITGTILPPTRSAADTTLPTHANTGGGPPQQAQQQHAIHLVGNPHPQPHVPRITPPAPTPFVGLTTKLPNNSALWHGTAPAHLPSDFDWEAYLHYNADVRKYGVQDPRLAAAHYLGWGFREQRVYKRLRVVLRYTACGGLMNQHYSHVAAVTLGAMLGAHVILPHALRRESFGLYFNPDPKRNRVRWMAAPFNTLWHSSRIIDIWRSQGLELQLGPVDPAHQPNYLHPRTAFQSYPVPHFRPEHVVRVDNLYLKAHDLNTLAEHIMRLVVTRASEVAHQVDAYQKQYPPLLVDLPCTLFSISTFQVPLAAQIARNFEFSPRIQVLADKVVSRMAESQPGPFNGLHLRIEEDAADWAQILGGRTKLWQLYLDQCSAAGFRQDMPLYIATGLLTYQHQSRMDEVRTKLQPYASSLSYKERYLTPDDLQGLHPEQQALIDFLVLVRSHHFVGISVSTFSVFIREYRYLHNISPRSTSHLVDGRKVGTEPLFARAAVFK